MPSWLLFNNSTWLLKLPTFSSTFVKASVISLVTPVDRLLNEVDIEPSEVLIVVFKVSFNEVISVFKFAISSFSLFSLISSGFDLKFR